MYDCAGKTHKRWNVSWGRGGVSAAVFAMCVAELLVGLPMRPVALTGNVLLILCVMAMPVAPIISATAAVAIDAVFAMLAHTPLGIGTMTILLGIGLISYGYGTAAACIALCIAGIEQFSLSVILTDALLPWRASILIVLTYCMTAGTGLFVRITARNRKRAEHDKDVRRRLAMRNRDIELAMRLHDHAAGELSIIARMAQSHLRQSTVDAELWERVNDLAVNGLTDIHLVIEELHRQGIADEPSDIPHKPSRRSIVACLEEHDCDLNQSGIRGRSHVRFEAMPNGASEDMFALFLKFIGELYANIAKHGEGEYAVAVIWGADEVRIAESNGVAKSSQGQVQSRIGRGLTYYGKLITQAGGTVDYGVKDDKWELSAVIR